MKLKIKTNLVKSLGYFIIFYDDISGKELYSDYQVANYLNVDFKLYEEKLIEFGANMELGGLFFHYKKDIKKVEEWIDSIFLMRKLEK